MNTPHFPVQIIFRHLPYSAAIETRAQEYASKLGQFFDSIMGCNIVLEAHHNHHKGNIYHVSIVLKVPRGQLVVNRDPAKNHAHENAYVALHDAFNAIGRKLKGWARKLRGNTKYHAPQLEGRVLEISPMVDYGLIETIDGKMVRFNSNSVINYDFNKLEIGDRVRFVEVQNMQGPAASTVYVGDRR